MMGRKPRLAVDLNMGTNLPEYGPSSSLKYVTDLQRRLTWAHKLAQKQMEKEANKAKKYYDRKVRCSQISPGDLVLVKRMAFKGKHKIQDRWEHNVYEVLESCRGSPLVFRVQREDGEGDVRILHRNLLLPLRTRIPEEEPDPPSPSLYSSSNPVFEPEESLKDEQEVDPVAYADSQSEIEEDEPSVSERPWTRSQGPPPALVGTKALSKCILNSDLVPDPQG